MNQKETITIDKWTFDGLLYSSERIEPYAKALWLILKDEERAENGLTSDVIPDLIKRLEFEGQQLCENLEDVSKQLEKETPETEPTPQ